MGGVLVLASLDADPAAKRTRRTLCLIEAVCRTSPTHLIARATDAAGIRLAESLRPGLTSLAVFRQTPAPWFSTDRSRPKPVRAAADPAMGRTMAELLKAGAITAIVAADDALAQFALGAALDRPLLVDFCEVASARQDSGVSTAPAWRQAALRRDAARRCAWERIVAAHATHSIFESEAEAKLFRQRSKIRPNRVCVVADGEIGSMFPGLLDPARRPQ